MSEKHLIEGVKSVCLREISDNRGAILHMVRCDSPDFIRFGECYFSEVYPGAVKAWKRHRIQTQNIAVPVGRVRLVIYDARLNSPTVGVVQEVELGRPDSYKLLIIPPMLWYGFSCISKGSALLVNCADEPHDPSESETKALGWEEIPYLWSK